MKCKQCGERYHLDWAQPGPGGSSSPGYFFWGFILFVIATILLYFYEISPWYWVTLGIGVFVLIQVPIAYSDCTEEEYSGKQCPNCKAFNRAFWWSIQCFGLSVNKDLRHDLMWIISEICQYFGLVLAVLLIPLHSFVLWIIDLAGTFKPNYWYLLFLWVLSVLSFLVGVVVKNRVEQMV